MVARRIEQGRQEGCGAAHLRFQFQRLEAQHHRRAMFADAGRHLDDLALIIVAGVDHDMAIFVGQGDEVALRVDHHLLHHRRAFLQQAAQKMRLARPGIALDEQTGGKQFLDIDQHGIARAVISYADAGGHEHPLAQPVACAQPVLGSLPALAA